MLVSHNGLPLLSIRKVIPLSAGCNSRLVTDATVLIHKLAGSLYLLVLVGEFNPLTGTYLKNPTSIT